MMTKQKMVGDPLYDTVLGYFAVDDFQDSLGALQAGIVNYRAPSYGTFRTVLTPQYWYGLPKSVALSGLNMDINSLTSIRVDKSNDTKKWVAFNQATYARASAMESLVPQQLFSTPTVPAESVSAVNALALADAHGQKIWTITQSNLSTALASIQLPAQVSSDITNAVNAGKVVTTQSQPVSYAGGQFTGYIITDPATGAGAYLLGDGTNGDHTGAALSAALGIIGLSFETVVTVEQTVVALIKATVDEVLDALGKASSVVGLILTITDALYECQGASSTDLLEVVALGILLFAIVAVLALIPGLIGILISLIASFLANKAMAGFTKSTQGCST